LNKIFVTGCAGFLGSNMVDYLIKDKNNYITGFDNFSTGKYKFIEESLKNSNFNYIYGDIIENYDLLEYNMQNMDIVFHFAANADVRYGLEHPYKDLEQNTIVTFHVLEAMRKNNVKKIVFTSTGSIYGSNTIYPTPENAPIPIQNSLYGASKLACEGLIEAYCEGYDLNCWIYRLVSVMGNNYHHGCLYDFYKKLLKDNKKMSVLGNGNLPKSYFSVADFISGVFVGLNKSNEKINIFNLGTNETCIVKQIIGWMIEYLNINPEINYGSDIAWKGDNHIHLNCDKIRNLDWIPKYTIKESVIQTLQFFDKNQWLFGDKK
jgi:UDP-glucose 4-epimerase